jgi:hypothetical protein
MARPLLDKLGWKMGMAAIVLDAPPELADAFPFTAAPDGSADWLLGFVRRSADVAPMLDRLLPAYRRGGALWIAYPKKTGAIRTDISRDQGWEALSTHDLLGVTQVAIDETWSALRFRYRDEIKVISRKSG